MLKYCIKRILSLIPVVFVISVLLFSMMKLMPGDPIKLSISPSVRPEYYDEVYEAQKKKMGFDKPIPIQYVNWVKNTASGDLGMSITYKEPVSSVIARPMKNTVIMNVFVLSFSLTISIYAGIRSAIKKGKFIDQFWQIFSLIGMSVPSFFIALCLIYIFSFTLKIAPSGGMPIDTSDIGSWIYHLALPVATLTIMNLAGTIRYVRNAMLEALSEDYIRTARSKGLSEKVIIYSHAFRNALIPIVTVVIIQISTLFSGSMIAEQVFAWDGLGVVLITALNKRDFMLVIALNMFYAVIYLVSNFICDIVYALVDPRIKLD
ncbi:ABC transporter permease [Absiella sp. AM22-9]|uniref:ABC transporter permease n=1 Tax=Absiella sp. AM22-9 TaxID=2291996 RepID=UPI000E420070|nr:ABC transporter permease [Absiella sp. AM22-9]RGB55216.1 ABC transporter permease [Absiella sp. AM22-9]